MPMPNFRGAGWCQNIAHSDYLHIMDESCVEPVPLAQRMEEMTQAAQLGRMEGLTEKIDKLREQAAEKAFQKIIEGYKKLPDYKREV